MSLERYPVSPEALAFLQKRALEKRAREKRALEFFQKGF
jgi:hypothetical protein